MNEMQLQAALPPAMSAADEGMQAGEIFRAILGRWRLVVIASMAGGLLALGGSFLIKPTFTARTSFLPPQQAQSAAASALGALGALAGVAGGGLRTTGDQYLALLKSRTMADRMVDRFELQKVYDEELRLDARMQLAKSSRMELGRKDGFLSVEVDDHDPQRAAAMANAYVEELQRMAAGLALTEAQQRRVFFEGKLTEVRTQLSKAQQALQSAGINTGTLKAEPKATADSYAKLRAELTSAEVRLQALRRSLTEEAPEVQRQLAAASALRSNLQQLESEEPDGRSSGYIAAYREYKYQETLFELIARQLEAARVDEGREGGQLQVVDSASAPERKSKPRRSILTLLGIAVGLAASCGFAVATAARALRRA